jgi:uncharacterized phage protein (TIGR01671 family)
MWVQKPKQLLSVFLHLIEQDTIGGGEKFDLMQYTGLHDKSGVEICEGDVVRSVSEEDGENMLVVIHHVYQGTFQSGFSLVNPDTGDDDYYHDRVEVIGNIYENPELLK